MSNTIKKILLSLIITSGFVSALHANPVNLTIKAERPAIETLTINNATPAKIDDIGVAAITNHVLTFITISSNDKDGFSLSFSSTNTGKLTLLSTDATDDFSGNTVANPTTAQEINYTLSLRSPSSGDGTLGLDTDPAPNNTPAVVFDANAGTPVTGLSFNTGVSGTTVSKKYEVLFSAGQKVLQAGNYQDVVQCTLANL